ncbi:MAG: SprT-like domain-containing protein [Halobacteriaceae archaeon]
MADDPVARYAVTPACSRAEFLAAVKLYARAVVERHDLSADVSALDWSVSARAKRRAGAVHHRDGDPKRVTLAWRQFENEGWRATAATVRHELAHVHLLTAEGDGGHGPAFRRLAERLDTHVHCERFTPPAYWVVCTDCDARLARYRRSKLVKNPETYRCGDCGGRLRVEEA